MASVTVNENTQAAVDSLSTEDLAAVTESFSTLSVESQDTVLSVVNTLSETVIEVQETGGLVITGTNDDGVSVVVGSGDVTIDLSASTEPASVQLAEGNQTIDAGAGDSIAFTAGGEKTISGVADGATLDFSAFSLDSVNALVEAVTSLEVSDVDADGIDDSVVAFADGSTITLNGVPDAGLILDQIVI